MATTSKAGDKPVKVKVPAKSAVKPAAAKPAAEKKAVKTEKPATKPAAKATMKASSKTTAAAKPAAATKMASAPASSLKPEQRRFYVEVAAYYIAERRGFHGSSQLDDWVQAEAEIDRLLQEGILKP